MGMANASSWMEGWRGCVVVLSGTLVLFLNQGCSERTRGTFAEHWSLADGGAGGAPGALVPVPTGAGTMVADPGVPPDPGVMNSPVSPVIPGGPEPSGAGSTSDPGSAPGSDLTPTTDYAAPGSFETRKETGGPGNAYTLHYPSELGRGGVLHPIITWGNGTGATPVAYQGLLAHWASHGFIVIASNSTQTGSGDEMMQGVRWLVAQHASAGSAFQGAVDTTGIGASGHSQGGQGTINSGTDPSVLATAPIQPGPAIGAAGQQNGPMFLMAGSSDTIVSAGTLVKPLSYEPSNVATVYGVLQGADHFEPVGDGGGYRSYTTAWFRLHLMGEEQARSVFYGDDCGICTDGDWVVERKNL